VLNLKRLHDCGISNCSRNTGKEGSMSDPSAALKSLHENLSRILYGKQQQILLAIATLP